MDLVGKELDKVSMKMEKTELASRAAGIRIRHTAVPIILYSGAATHILTAACPLDVEYQASIRQLSAINDKWILEWRAACDVCSKCLLFVAIAVLFILQRSHQSSAFAEISIA